MSQDGLQDRFEEHGAYLLTLRRQLRNLGNRAPVVVVLDDLHWAEKSSLLLLQFLAREIADARLLVLATYRDVEVTVGHPLGEVLPSLRRERTVDRVLLRGLPEDEVHGLLERLRGGEVPESFAANLARETAGNPFYIKEILRHLLEEGVAYRQGGRWETRLDEKDIRLPESVREVVGRRLARLGDSCRKLLTLGSVIGPEFGLDVLRKAATEVEEDRVLDVLDEAASARVVDVVTPVSRYRFSHALIRETLYGELRTVERLQLHRRVAEALETLHGKHPEGHLAELAHHFLEAIPAADVGKAIGYATRAADHAAEQLAHQEAEVLYGRALQALELANSPDERLRCELLLKRGEAQWNAGGFENPVTCFIEAADLAKRIRDPELFARAALGFGGPGIGLAMAKESLREADILERALAALDAGDSILRARVMARMASLRHYREEFAELGRRALEMA
ncbi:MAG: ATP-binding protein, partial [Candidatus Binatia bacterium]